MMYVPHARDAVEWRRALGCQLGRATQVDDGGQADVANQPYDVGRRQVLQVVAAQQPGTDGFAAVLGGQAAQVTDIDGMRSSSQHRPWA
jgi:hypothetical protein